MDSFSSYLKGIDIEINFSIKMHMILEGKKYNWFSGNGVFLSG